MKYKPTVLLLFFSLSIVFSGYEGARAEEGEQLNCDITCPSGEKVVSFTDGNNVACVCSPETQMVPTEADPAVVDSGEYEDAGQKE